MKVTNVRIDLEDHHSLRAFCTLEIDGEFVVKQVKIVEKFGRLLVAMPSKKRTTPCVECNGPVPLTDEFCGACGLSQGPQEPRIVQLREWLHAEDGKKFSFYTDLFHPITKECRQKIEEAVLEAYAHAKDRSKDRGAAGHDAGGKGVSSAGAGTTNGGADGADGA